MIESILHKPFLPAMLSIHKKKAKNIVFSNLKHYFIYFNIILYNTPNI